MVWLKCDVLMSLVKKTNVYMIHHTGWRKHFKTGTPSSLGEKSITAENGGPDVSPRNVCAS